jgi:hypothetical protein
MPNCRFCDASLSDVFADLGMSPLANSYLKREQLASMEPFFPLRVWVCGSCRLVQLDEFETPAGIFSEYAYFSSFSTSWLAHAKHYVEQVSERFGVGPDSQVIEVASNDGYLLRSRRASPHVASSSAVRRLRGLRQKAYRPIS